jgi:hypothetical protein
MGKDGLSILELYQPPPRFEPIVKVDARGYHLFVTGQAGQTLQLERSQDLRVWRTWIMMTATGRAQEVVDESATGDRRQFYRALVIAQ